jgi:hypothetical protein
MIWNSEKENLERLINVEKKSYEEIGRIYNVCGNTIKKQAKKLGIELTPRREINPRETFNKKEIVLPEVIKQTTNNPITIKNNKNLGEIGERIAIGELAKFGIDVLLPMSDNLPYDFVIYYNNKFYKCQVKTTTPDSELLRFSITSSNWNTKTIHKYNKDEVDVFILCDLRNIYLFSIDDVYGKDNVYIRMSPAKNNQIKGVNFADDYIISTELIQKVLN